MYSGSRTDEEHSGDDENPNDLVSFPIHVSREVKRLFDEMISSALGILP
jgi:hypothetical protein